MCSSIDNENELNGESDYNNSNDDWINNGNDEGNNENRMIYISLITAIHHIHEIQNHHHRIKNNLKGQIEQSQQQRSHTTPINNHHTHST